MARCTRPVLARLTLSSANQTMCFTFLINVLTVSFSAALERPVTQLVSDPRKHAVVCENKSTGLNAAVRYGSDRPLKDLHLLIHSPK